MNQQIIEITSAGSTDKGRVRKHNEDAIYSDQESRLWIVADGMGGYASGEVASALSVETISQSVNQGVNVEQAIGLAHNAVVERTQTEPSTEGMASTVIVLRLENSHYKISWVGDSRAYRLRDNQLTQLSRDHSYLEWLVDKGMTRAEAANDPKQARLTQGVGLRTPMVDSVSGKVQFGDRYLLCSDGAYGELSDQEMEALLRTNNDCDTVCQATIQSAIKNGGRDNVSVIIVDIEPTKRKRLYRWLQLRVKLKKIAAAWRLWLPPVAAVILATVTFSVFLMLRS